MNRRQFLISITYTAAGICLSPSVFVRKAGGSDLPRTTYFNFSERFNELDLIEETRQIDFGDAKDRPFLIDGWSITEKNHTWALNNAASVGFYTFGPDLDKNVQIICSAFSHLKNQQMKIYLNDHFVTSLSVSAKERKFSLQLPSGFLNEGRNILAFIFSECGKPSDYGSNSDDRCLAVYFQKILLAEERAIKNRQRIALTGDGFISMPQNSAVRHFLYIEPDSRLLLEASASSEKPSDEFLITAGEHHDETELYATSSKDLPKTAEIDLKPFASRFVTLKTQYTGNADASDASPLIDWKGAVQAPRKSLPERPNLLFVVVDTLRADYCGCLGGPVNTPNIDKLAETGTLFQQAFSHIPITLPSHATLFSSLYPHETNVLNNGQHLSDQFRLMGEYFSGMRFFNTGMISLGTIDPETNIGQGFDRYTGTDPFSIRQAREINDALIDFSKDLNTRHNWCAFVHYSDPHDPYHGHDAGKQMVELRLNDEPLTTLDIGLKSTFALTATLRSGKNVLSIDAPCRFQLRQLDTAPRLPWEVLTGNTSGPYILNKTKTGKIVLQNDSGADHQFQFNLFITEFLEAEGIRENYQKEVAYVDRYVGEALDHFRKSGLLKDTIVVFTSDHGEGLGEHGENGHINQLYNSMVHVPLIISHPSKIAAGQKIRTRVRLIDILPTMMDIYGAIPPSHFRGKSLMPVIAGKEQSDRPVLAMTFKNEAPHNLASLTDGDHKIIKNMNTGALELFNVKTDPHELDNMIDKSFIMANRMEKALYDRLADCGYPLENAGQMKATPNTDPSTIEMLRGLGYTK